MPMVLSLRNPVAEDDHVSLFRNLGFLLSAVQLSTSVSLFRRMLTTDKLQCVLAPIFREIPMDYISFSPLIPKWHYHLCPGSAWRFSPSSLCPWYFFSQNFASLFLNVYLSHKTWLRNNFQLARFQFHVIFTPVAWVALWHKLFVLCCAITLTVQDLRLVGLCFPRCLAQWTF